MTEVSRIGSAGPAAAYFMQTNRLGPSLSQIAKEQMQQADHAFETALVERNRDAMAAVAASVYSSVGAVNSTPAPGSILRASA